MRFGFEDRTRELLRFVWIDGSISAAAASVGMDASNAARHLRTAERRTGRTLVVRRRGGRGQNARLTADGRRFLEIHGRAGVAQVYDSKRGVTPIRVGGRQIYAAGPVRPGPVEVEIRPDSVALERAAKAALRSSMQNRIAARVDSIVPESDGVVRVKLSAGALRLESLIVRGALRDLRLRVGSRVRASIKAVSLVTSARPRP